MQSERSQEYTPFPNDQKRNRLQVFLEIPLLIQTMEIPKGKRILEVGCGRGNALPLLSKLTEPEYLAGLDIDQELLMEAEKLIQRKNVPVALFHGDVRKMVFDMESFDIVLDFGTCYHIPKPEEAIKEITRVLKIGGSFITESRTSQLIAHPDRFTGEKLPWQTVPNLILEKHVGLWSKSIKT